MAAVTSVVMRKAALRSRKHAVLPALRAGRGAIAGAIFFLRAELLSDLRYDPPIAIPGKREREINKYYFGRNHLKIFKELGFFYFGGSACAVPAA